MFFGASNSSLFSYNHSKFSARHESNRTSDVSKLFWPRQDGRQFKAELVNFEQPKKQFTLTVCEKKLTVFPSKVSETLLLSKNLTYENFVSVAL